MVRLCYHEDKAVRLEAIWSFCNSTKVVSDDKILKMVQNGVLKLFADSLSVRSDEDSEIILIVCEGLKSIFNRQESIKKLVS